MRTDNKNSIDVVSNGVIFVRRSVGSEQCHRMTGAGTEEMIMPRLSVIILTPMFIAIGTLTVVCLPSTDHKLKVQISATCLTPSFGATCGCLVHVTTYSICHPTISTS